MYMHEILFQIPKFKKTTQLITMEHTAVHELIQWLYKNDCSDVVWRLNSQRRYDIIISLGDMSLCSLA